MKAKKKNYYYNICAAIALLIALMLLAGCNGGNAAPGGDAGSGDGGGQGGAESALSGATEDILAKIIDDATAALGENDAMPMTFIDPVAAENAPGTIGLLQDDFVSYVDEATVATASISTFAFQAAVIKCKSADDAITVSGCIEGGYDSGKWICVFPEQSLVAVSGPYVLLAAGSERQTNELAAAFRKLAGEAASGPNVFYKGETGGAADGGMALDIGSETPELE
jgi:hypothetical protein